MLIWGSGTLVKTLLSQGLVDELTLLIEPILLGGGKRLFPEDGTARPMQLVKAVTAGTGVQICTQRPAVEGLRRGSLAVRHFTPQWASRSGLDSCPSAWSRRRTCPAAAASPGAWRLSR